MEGLVVAIAFVLIISQFYFYQSMIKVIWSNTEMIDHQKNVASGIMFLYVLYGIVLTILVERCIIFHI